MSSLSGLSVVGSAKPAVSAPTSSASPSTLTTSSCFERASSSVNLLFSGSFGTAPEVVEIVKPGRNISRLTPFEVTDIELP